MDSLSGVSARLDESAQEQSLDWSNPTVASSCTPKIQELIILPTEQCNFRCTYCYEDFAIGAMPEEVQEGIERYLDVRIPELQQLQISWFGGEPLAARKIVLRLASHAKKVCDRYGVRLNGAFTTNAWLLDFDLFEQLLALDQTFYQITLDGWQTEHDTYRRKANGRPTFDRIWKNLRSFKAAKGDFTVQIRVHVRRDSWRSLETLLSAIAREFGTDPRFRIDLEHIRNFGGAGGATVIDPFSYQDFKVVEKELLAIYRGKVLEYFPDLRSDALSSGEMATSENEVDRVVGESGLEVCYAARPNSLLIRADGRIGKCTVALSDDRNTIGALNRDGTIQIDNQRLQPWIRGMASLDAIDLACPLARLDNYK